MIKELGAREKEVVYLICTGMSDKEIAASMRIHYRTVRSHMSNISDKWQVNGRTQIAIYAFAHDMHDPLQCWVDMGKL